MSARYPNSGAGAGSASSVLKDARLKMKARRRIVEDSDDDDEIITSPEVRAKPTQRTIPRRKGTVSVGPPNASGAGSSGVTRASGRPTAAAAVGVAGLNVATGDAGTSSGSEDNAWYSKPSSNPGVTVKRAKAMASPNARIGDGGWLSKNDPSKLTTAQRAKNVQLAKAQRQTTSRGKAKGRGGADSDGDSHRNYREGSRRRSGKESPTKGGSNKKSAARVTGRRGRAREAVVDDESEESCGESEEEEGEFEDDGESSGEDSANDLDLTDASEGDDQVQAPVTLKTATVEQKCPNKVTMSKNVTAAKSKGGQPAGNRGNAIAVDVNGGKAAVFSNGRSTGLPNTASNGIKRDNNPKRVDGKRSDGVEVVRVKSGGSAHGGGRAGDGVGDKRRNKKKRRRVQESDDDSEDNRGGGRKEVKMGTPPRKKKEVYHYRRGDDDMDDSDRGSDSEDCGARARKVLEECSALSKKLASVISSWAVSDDDDGSEKGAGSSRGALDVTSLKAGGRAVTTNEEIAKACPGLKLKPYQLVGVNWMCLMRDTGVNGVLADEMGLGKTVQTIAFFALLMYRRKGAPPRRPHMVVVPSSVLDNWDSELKKFCPSLNAVKYHGSLKERAKIRQSLSDVSSGAAREDMPDIILTTYVIWERESSGEDRGFLKKFRYDYMVLDEGHSIKNIKSSRFQRLRVVNARHRLLLSGTPVQNNLGELLALLSFLMPEIFRSDVIETLLEFLGEGEQKSDSSSHSVQVREVRGMLAPFVLRRLKASVLKQLVGKTEMVERVPLSEAQRSLYNGVLEEHLKQKAEAIKRALIRDKPNGCDGVVAEEGFTSTIAGKTRSKRSGVVGDKGVVDMDTDANGGESNGMLEAAGFGSKEIKNIFTELRKAANHPLMLMNHFKGGGKVEEIVNVLHRASFFGGQATREMVAKEVRGYSDFDLHQVCLNFESLRHFCLNEDALFTSAKMERLKTLLPKLVKENHRILLFSQWTRLLDLFEVMLDSMKLNYCRLDGSTPVSERKKLIDRFSSDTSISVFLLSTRAGGLGINLTAADTVILHDVDFNPENDRQAEDRCHRIGQTRPVTVIKMVAEGTVDEDIYSMGERKKELNKSVLNDSASKDKDAASTISGILKRAIQIHMASSS